MWYLFTQSCAQLELELLNRREGVSREQVLRTIQQFLPHPGYNLGMAKSTDFCKNYILLQFSLICIDIQHLFTLVFSSLTSIPLVISPTSYFLNSCAAERSWLPSFSLPKTTRLLSFSLPVFSTVLLSEGNFYIPLQCFLPPLLKLTMP